MMKLALSGRKVLVIGARRTGAAVARYLARQGAEVLLSDRASTGFDDERARLAGSTSSGVSVARTRSFSKASTW